MKRWSLSPSRSRLRAAALFVALVLPTTGMACSRDCTDIGCSDAISLRVSGVELTNRDRFSIEACIDGDCTEGLRITTSDLILGRGAAPEVLVIPQGGPLLYVSLQPPGQLEVGDVHQVSLKFKVDGQPSIQVNEEVTMEASQPNGPGCPSTCALAEVDVDV